jgi:hypothetical protein
MMHEREKSGSAKVAVKPTNKAERSVAEQAEPRAGADTPSVVFRAKECNMACLQPIHRNASGVEAEYVLPLSSQARRS